MIFRRDMSRLKNRSRVQSSHTRNFLSELLILERYRFLHKIYAKNPEMLIPKNEAMPVRFPMIAL